ncbi:MAG: hypothetical protein IJM44_01230 [Ruminococcus sp.]|nr:hypothetical protein [Ruminococcus sp.]
MPDNFNNTGVGFSGANADFSNAVSGVENVTKKKGKGKKIAIISGVSAAAVVGGGVALYNFSPFVKNQVKLRTMKPANYYAWVYEENSEDLAKKVADQYRLMLGEYEDGSSSSMSLRFTASEDGRNYALDKLYDEYEGSDDDFDTLESLIENFSSFEVGLSSADSKEKLSGSLFTKYNGDSLVSFDYAADLGAMDFFFRVPELTEKWIGASLGDYFYDNMDDEEYEIYSNLMDIVKDPESCLTPEQLEDMIVRYVGIWTESVDGVKLRKDETVKIAGMSVDYTAVSVKLDGEDLAEICKKYLKELKNDDTVRDIAVGKLGVSEEDYEALFDEAIEDIDGYIDEFDPDEDTAEVKFTTYVDAKGVIRGFDLEFYEDDEMEGELFAAMGKDGDKVRGEFTVTEDDECVFTAELKATEGKKETYSGDITITVYDEAYDYDEDDYVEKTYEVSIDFDNYNVVDKEKGYFNCDLTIDLSQIDEDIDPIKLRFETDGSSQNISYDISYDDTNIGTLTLSYSFDKSADVDIPSTDDAYMIDIDDPKFDLGEYVSEQELSDFIWDILTQIGVDEDMADELADEAAAEAFEEAEYEMNRVSDYY